MISFRKDEEISPLKPGHKIKDLAILLSLLCGHEIDLQNLSQESLHAINGFLNKKNIRLGYEEFNELLLLFNQDRVESPFFDFFFLKKSPIPKPNKTKREKQSVTLDELKEGVKRFRGFALLCFGNFRYAFRTLSEGKNPSSFVQLLNPWNSDSRQEKELFRKRQDPLTPLTGTSDEIEKSKTWLVGKFSGAVLKSDGETLRDDLVAELRKRQKLTHKEVIKLTKTCNELIKLRSAEKATRTKAGHNSIKYLTWDYLDVYVATSMRQPWEYEETYDFIKNVFRLVQKDIPKVRWFDPTQADTKSAIDKGLLEGLMLKRAKCTIYMAQEGDTLGKDSELAATLAQGKPVIAYVRSGDPSKHEKELKRRPLSYFRQRLLTLLADGFFDKRDNRIKVSNLLKKLKLSVEPEQLRGVGRDTDEVHGMLKLFDDFKKECKFQIIGKTTESVFRNKYRGALARSAKLLATIESVAADNRAATIKNTHPLGFQVHLESGVANGILVARNEEECADLVKGVLTRTLTFDIGLEKSKTEEGTEKTFATVLLEVNTKSRFRVVTKDACLTNSFWNFYLETRKPN